MDEKYFDCRRYVRPGDHVMVDSSWCCEAANNGRRVLGTPWAATVVEVYEKFIRVKLKKTIETINRWDILELRGCDLMNGCFYGFEVRG